MDTCLPGLDTKLAFLRLPGSFPEATSRVEARETHMSWVFVLDTHVYKLKKPVRYDCLDFRTLASRRFFCGEELRLNRRLAPDVYLGVVALNLDGEGKLNLGGPGRTVDWLVRMRRLPGERMLDALIREGGLREGDIDRIAATLAGFYGQLPPESPEPRRFRRRLCRHIEEDAAGLRAAGAGAGLPESLIDAIAHAQLGAVAQLRDVFDARLRAGRVVEGHGDLRPEHVCLEGVVTIIDCLEFARILRVQDITDEIAYLALECERLGAPAEGAHLLECFAQRSGDRPPPELVSFYKSYRATSRAHIAIRHLLEPQADPAHWTRRAAQYLRLAESHLGAVAGVPAQPGFRPVQSAAARQAAPTPSRHA
ncbi:hypothetical protein [Massilia sp. SYSU DXS3249]